jgi:hypothetical protein
MLVRGLCIDHGEVRCCSRPTTRLRSLAVLASLVRKKKFQGQDYIFCTNHLNFKGIHQNGETSRSRRYSSSLCGGGEAAYAYAASSQSNHVTISRPSNPAVLQVRLPSIPHQRQQKAVVQSTWSNPQSTHSGVRKRLRSADRVVRAGGNDQLAPRQSLQQPTSQQVKRNGLGVQRKLTTLRNSRNSGK